MTIVHKSAIRKFVLDEMNLHAKVIVVHPNKFNEWRRAMEKTINDMIKMLEDRGVTVVNDEAS